MFISVAKLVLFLVVYKVLERNNLLLAIQIILKKKKLMYLFDLFLYSFQL